MEFDQKCAFHISTVKKTEDLYGWGTNEYDLLYNCLLNIYNGNAFLLCGERRSGKTSILNCICYEIENKKDSNILPVLIDFQQHNFVRLGKERAYRHIFASLCKAMIKAKKSGQDWIPSPLYFPSLKVDFLTCKDLSQFPETCSTDSLFGEIEDFFKQHNKTLVLLFDEYERLPDVFHDVKDSFFYPFRKFQENYEQDQGGIISILAGAETTSQFSQRFGSPQFNYIGQILYVTYIQQDAFEKMWTDLYERSSPVIQKNIDSHGKTASEIYELCGGRPGFAKCLGSNWGRHSDSASDPLEIWFRDIFQRQPKDAQNILLDLAAERPVVSAYSRDAINRLKRLALIEENPDPEIGGLQIRGKLWQEFLCRRLQEERQPPQSISITHAGDLAAAIVQHDLCEILLELRKGKGEKDDWLEFKAALVPPKERIKQDKNQEGKPFSKDDYIWHVLKAIIAMLNTRGGLVCIGIDDHGHIIGIPQSHCYSSDDDFIRNEFTNKIKINDKALNIYDGTKIKIPSFNIDLLQKSNNIIIYHKQYQCKDIIFVVIKPVINNGQDHPQNKDNILRIHEYDQKNREREYILCRASHAENREIVGEKNIQDFLNTPQKLDDLHEFWRQLVRR